MGISQAMLDDRSMQEEEEDGGPLDGSKTVEHVHQHYHRMPLLKRIESHLMARFKQSNAVRSGHTTIADGGHGDTGKR